MHLLVDQIPTLRADDDDLDVAGPISWQTSQAWPTAFVCEDSDDGDTFFGRQIQLQIFRDCPFEITLNEDSHLPSHRWYASLVRIEKDDNLKGAFVVAASTPYSTDWFDFGQLKLPYKQGSQKREGRLLEILSDERGWQIALSEQTSDLFATDGKYLSAMLARPDRVDRTISLGRRTYEPWPKDDPLVSKASRPGICLGICHDIEGTVQRLMNYWYCAGLVEDARAGDLFAKFYQKHSNYQHSPKPRPVHPEAKPYADRAMAAAIKKALAGPISDDFVDHQTQPRVSQLAGWIYLQLMYALCQRLERETDTSPTVYGTPDIDVFGAVDRRVDVTDELDMVQAKIQRSDDSKGILINKCIELSKSTDERSRRLSCIFAVAICLECGREPDLIHLLQILQSDTDSQVRQTARSIAHFVS